MAIVKKFLPVVLGLVWKLLRDVEFQALIVKVAHIEAEWVFGDKDAEVALNEIIFLFKEYFANKAPGSKL